MSSALVQSNVQIVTSAIINTACPSITTFASVMHWLENLSLRFPRNKPSPLAYLRRWKQGSLDLVSPWPTFQGHFLPSSFGDHLLTCVTVVTWRDGALSCGNHSGDVPLTCQVWTLINHSTVNSVQKSPGFLDFEATWTKSMVTSGCIGEHFS